MPDLVPKDGNIARDAEGSGLIGVTPTIGWVARAIAQGAANVFEVSSVGPQIDYSAVRVEVEVHPLELV